MPGLLEGVGFASAELGVATLGRLQPDPAALPHRPVPGPPTVGRSSQCGCGFGEPVMTSHPRSRPRRCGMRRLHIEIAVL